MDLIDEGESGNTPEFTVSELSGAVKRVIEGEFGFVRVKGEVGRVSRPRSGHVYLDLKDDRAVISGVMWKGVASKPQAMGKADPKLTKIQIDQLQKELPKCFINHDFKK